MRPVRRTAAALALPVCLALAACAAEAPETRDLTVMTRNLYLGADLTPLFGASSVAGLAARATAVWRQVEASDVAGRAAAVAAEIAAAEPDVVGLQEVSLWQVDSAADGPLTRADEPRYDVLELLTDALAEAGGPAYEVVAVAEQFDGEVPTTLGYDVRLTDRDVVLARADRDDLAVAEAGTGQFASSLTVPAVPGFSLTVPRGWAAADVTLGDDRTVRVFTTHLEAIDGPEQVAQGAELRERAARAEVPAVVLGDINSRASGEQDTTTYADFVADGWTDAWSAAAGDDPGDTCCQAPDLRNEASALRERIDVVFVGEGLTATAASRTGADPAVRTGTGLWASDHAGVVVALAVAAQ